jgi:hypothetical protein
LPVRVPKFLSLILTREECVPVPLAVVVDTTLLRRPTNVSFLDLNYRYSATIVSDASKTQETMKIRMIIIKISYLASLSTVCLAFGMQRPHVAFKISSSSIYAVPISRRCVIASIVTASAASFVQQFSSIQPALASDTVVDYSKIQDLLGPDGGDFVVPYQTLESGKRPTWLTEPTAEFKESEQKSIEFKRKNLLLSKQFQALLDVVSAAPNDESVLLDALDSLRRLVKSGGGLPTGVTKEEIIKTCRRRKSKKYWPTAVEVA